MFDQLLPNLLLLGQVGLDPLSLYTSRFRCCQQFNHQPNTMGDDALCPFIDCVIDIPMTSDVSAKTTAITLHSLHSIISFLT